eukprot:gnl/Carplike_NY0171/2570_a3452_422.p1 GENE.gnl/Carplike_NY0171/2570_a3452_422~~gnl/Carplike_NY0171/2570_a3452_422.p1  ORF type:complete len:232 (-),score=29.95 gnl/Carplike_NY0171/2570_a3452_422:522-1217(-)
MALGKLKFYCTVCKKQCRDENDYRNHIQTPQHQRMLSVLHNDPEKLVNEFSKQFKKGFVAVLSKRYRDRTVNANRVYNEYIQDKHHVHMTSTKWVTLSSFCKDLAKEENGITITPSAIGYDIKYVKVSKSLERQRKKQELLKKQDILRISKLEAEEKLKLRERRRIAAKKALEYSEKRRLLLSRQREAEEQRRKLGIEDSESGSTEEGSDFDDIFDVSKNDKQYHFADPFA